MKPYLVVLGTWSVEAVIALSRLKAVQVTETCWVVVAAGSAKLVAEAVSSFEYSAVDIECVIELPSHIGDLAVAGSIRA